MHPAHVKELVYNFLTLTPDLLAVVRLEHDVQVHEDALVFVRVAGPPHLGPILLISFGRNLMTIVKNTGNNKVFLLLNLRSLSLRTFWMKISPEYKFARKSFGRYVDTIN
jgi:hypothetical protein